MRAAGREGYPRPRARRPRTRAGATSDRSPPASLEVIEPLLDQVDLWCLGTLVARRIRSRQLDVLGLVLGDGAGEVQVIGPLDAEIQGLEVVLLLGEISL